MWLALTKSLITLLTHMNLVDNQNASSLFLPMLMAVKPGFPVLYTSSFSWT